MTSIDTLFSLRVCLPKPYKKPLKTPPKFRSKTLFLNRSLTVLCEANSASTAQSGDTNKEDFVTRVLKQNPSQIEPRYLIGDKFYTSKEKQDLSKKKNVGFIEIVDRLLNLKGKVKKEGNESENEEKAVYLKDILREYKGKLYVPEQVFSAKLSEEEEFDRNLEELPKMGFEDFKKAMESDKVKLLTSKEAAMGTYANDYRGFIVDLKEIPGEKSLHRTKWTMRLNENEAQTLLEEYTGPFYEIERHMASSVGKLPEYPHPVASSISSRMMVELGMVTAVMAAAAVVVGGFLASAVFAVTSFIFVATVYVAWPIAKPFVKLFLGITFSILEGVWDYVVDIFSDGGLFSKFYEFYTFGGVSASIEMLKPIMLVLLTMVLDHGHRERSSFSREHMQSMDRTSEKIAYGAGVAAGTVGGVAGVVCGSKMAFDWVIDRYDEFETRSIERIMRKIDANRRDRNTGVSVASRSILTEPKSDGM